MKRYSAKQFEALGKSATAFATGSRAPATVEAYARDWKLFDRWCKSMRRDPMPASVDTLCLYISKLAQDHRPAGIERKLVAIANRHKTLEMKSKVGDPRVRQVLAGIRRKLGTAQVKKAPLVVEDLRKAIAKLPRSIDGLRDRAMLLVGFGGALRRSELCALTSNDVKVSRQGLEVTIRKSKTDQEGKGRVIGIPRGSRADFCPVRSLEAYMRRAGKVVRLDQGLWPGWDGPKVNKLVKRVVRSIGLDPKVYGAHSLRAGFVTSAAKAGHSELEISRTTGHKDFGVLRGYIRAQSVWDMNAGRGLL